MKPLDLRKTIALEMDAKLEQERASRKPSTPVKNLVALIASMALERS